MAILDELVTQIENPDLRARIAAEVEKLAKQKKFGLVFEEHLPECTPLWDIPVKAGHKAALKTGHVNDFFTVLRIEDGVATCLNKDKSATAEFPVEELVCVAEFGEPIYPYSSPSTRSATRRTATCGTRSSRLTTTMPCSCWSTSMPARWTVSTSTRLITRALAIGNTTTTMWTITTSTATASGCRLCRSG